MFMEVIALTSYADWLAGLKNRKYVLRIEKDKFGDSKSVGSGVSELRFTFGLAIAFITPSAKERSSYC